MAFHSLTKSRKVSSPTTGKTTSRTTPSGWGQCGIGQFEQQVLLAADALDVIEQFTFDLAFGAGTDAVDRLDQQVDQIVGEAARAQIDKRGKPGDSRRIGMPAKFMRSLDCHSPPAALQIAWQSMIEQIGWKVDTTDQFQLRQFLLHAGEAGPPRIAAQRQERRRRAACGVFTLGRAQQLVKTFADRRRQSSVDIGVKAFLMRTKRCARNALYTFDTRRFNRQFTASGFQSFDHRRNLAAGFGDAQARKLLETPPADTLKGVRDRAILATLLYHGIRREELCGLRVKDLHSRQGVMHFRVKGKRSKIRFVPVNAAAQRMIEDYLALTGHRSDVEGGSFPAGEEQSDRSP